MKRFLTVCILITVVLFSIVAKEGFKVSFEVGRPLGISIGYQINDKIDAYLTGSFGFGSRNFVDEVIGVQYKVTSFSIKTSTFNVLTGVQVGATQFFKNEDRGDGIILVTRVTGALTYDWTWKNVGDFSVYLKTGLGTGFRLTGDTSTCFSWNVVLGCSYYI